MTCLTLRLLTILSLDYHMDYLLLHIYFVIDTTSFLLIDLLQVSHIAVALLECTFWPVLLTSIFKVSIRVILSLIQLCIRGIEGNHMEHPHLCTKINKCGFN